MASQASVRFGNPESWVDFRDRYPLFLERFPNLERAIAIAFNRKGEAREPVDRVVYFSGRLCIEDFFEILLLAGNGYGMGGLKILRGMYERAVTARYLHLHPEETDRFLDFHWVQQHKVTGAIKKTFGAEALPKEKIEEIDTNYKEVRDKFIVTACRECGRKDINYTWSSLDFVSMAHATGSTGRLIALAYYLPMREAHSTSGAILSRLGSSPEGGLVFDGGPQYREAKISLMTAHNLVLDVIDLQKEHFALLALEEPIKECLTDFQEMWKPKPDTPSRSG